MIRAYAWGSRSTAREGGEVNFTLGVFDVFAYGIPGGLYVSLAAYIAFRAGVLGPGVGDALRSSLGVLGLVVLSYLVGNAMLPVAQFVEAKLPSRQQRGEDRARLVFRERNPALADRAFVDMHLPTLRAGLEQHNPVARAEISRLRSGGLMLEHSSVILAFAAVVAVIETLVGRALPWPPAIAGVLALLSTLCLWRGRTLSFWSLLHTLEAGAWLFANDLTTMTDGGPSGSDL